MRRILPHEENHALREMARAIPHGDIQSDHVRTLIADMKELLSREKFGVALAASQVGEAIALFIVSGRALARAARAEDDESEVPALPDQIYINPQITNMSRAKKEKHEGCLSIRGVWGMVPRAEKATIVAFDEHGNKFTRGASGFLAHIFQHEMDHLGGILYTDKATELYDDEPEES